MAEKTKSIIERILIPVLLAAALIAVSLWGSSQAARAEDYKRSTADMYKRSFMELADGFSNIEKTLSKLMVVNSPAQYVLLLDDIWRQSGTCVGLMSQIPSSHLDTAELNRFVVQLGDYAHALTKSSLAGKPMTEEDTKQLQDLYTACVDIANDLNTRVQNGDIPNTIITNEQYYTSASDVENETAQGGENDQAGDETSDEANQAGEAAGNTEGSDKQQEESLSKFPVLIYDGPYSESSENREPRGLTGNKVSEGEALGVAMGIAGDGVQLSYSGPTDGSIPTYEFESVTEDGRYVYISITQQGGKLLTMMKAAKSDRDGIPEDEAERNRYRDAAVKYLSDQGYGEMRATYAQYYGGAALINCAAVQNDVILYSDLIKVWVDREDMEIIGVDARNYFFNHIERQLEQPAITLEEAQGYVSQNLTVQSNAVALIPITPQTERLCYEFKGVYGENEYIVYINAQTGEEEQIFQIIKTENGQLVM
ncbi:MAG TPA: germination protein YpeB [Clostridia bacterium]|nr:germination protein YpeB [Clostridia bacterium]